MSYESSSKRNLRGILNELIERTNSIIMRLRLVEQRNQTSMTKTDSLYNTSMEQVKESKKLMKNLEKKVKMFEDKLFEMESGIKSLNNKINNFATKSELKGLEQSLNLYNPIKSKFVTRKEVKDMLKEKTSGKK